MVASVRACLVKYAVFDGRATQLLAVVPFGFVVPLILLASLTVAPVGTGPCDHR